MRDSSRLSHSSDSVQLTSALTQPTILSIDTVADALKPPIHFFHLLACRLAPNLDAPLRVLSHSARSRGSRTSPHSSLPIVPSTTHAVQRHVLPFRSGSIPQCEFRSAHPRFVRPPAPLNTTSCQGNQCFYLPYGSTL